MIEGTFSDEHPEQHWPVEVRDRVVLDLGAGDFGRIGQLPHPSTVEHWLARGAAMVIAVDGDESDLAHLARERVRTLARHLAEPDDIAALLRWHRPDVVKVDIEGAEALLLDVEPEALTIPRAYAIEAHNYDLHDRLRALLEAHGYVVRWVLRNDPQHHVSVLYAERPEPVPTIAVIPTINTLGLTACLTEHLLLCDRVDEVWLYDGGTDGTHRWAEHRASADPRLRWFGTRGVGIYDLWNRAILENSGRPTNVAVLNSDIRLPLDGIGTMCDLMRAGNYQLATVDPTRSALYSQHHQSWHPELHELSAPIVPEAVEVAPTLVVGWAYVVAAEFWVGKPFAICPDLEWWYGDDDLFRRTALRGGRICHVRGVGSDHIGSASDPDNPDKATKIARDTELFARLWPPQP